MTDLILYVHVSGAQPYQIGDEIWQHSLADAITAEASTIAEDAGSDLLEAPPPPTATSYATRSSPK